MIKQLDMRKFEEYISQFPVYEYRILDTKAVSYTHLTLPTT